MPVGNFLTLVQYATPVKVILSDNSPFGTVELETSVSGLPSYGTTNENVNVAAIAPGRFARGPRGAVPAAHRGFAEPFPARGPAPADVITEPAACRFLRRSAPGR